MTMENPVFYIGYDSKEDIAYRVCKESLIKNSSLDIKVNSLKSVSYTHLTLPTKA